MAVMVTGSKSRMALSIPGAEHGQGMVNNGHKEPQVDIYKTHESAPIRV